MFDSLRICSDHAMLIGDEEKGIIKTIGLKGLLSNYLSSLFSRFSYEAEE